MLELENKKLRKRQLINNYACICLAIIYSIITTYFFVRPCFPTNPWKFHEYSRVAVTCMFSLLGIAFFYTGVTMNLSLKQYFPRFYYNFRCFLWSACFFLTLPLFLRALINLAEHLSEKFYEWFNGPEDMMITWSLYLILTTYIPVIT